MSTFIPDRFEPVRFLKEDRHSVTFVGTDHELRRNDVVVKILRRNSFGTDQAALKSFFSWYRGLRHSCIPEVLEAGLTRRRDLYCVREFLQPSQLFASRDVATVRALLSAVDFLNSRRHVHGSIKPANVFAVPGGVVCLADPLIPGRQNKILNEEDIRFSAPEVLSGGAASHESDLYSLGALLYRFYSGRDVFDDSDLKTLRNKYTWASPRHLSNICHVEQKIGDHVTNLIHRDPARRKQAFEALKEEVGVHVTSASRAPAVGMARQLDAVEQFLSAAEQRLRFVLIEGAVGMGKSRFTEELRHRSLFHPRHAFIVYQPGPKDSLREFAEQLTSLCEERRLSLDNPAISRLRNFVADENGAVKEPGRVHQDLVSALGSIARQIPLTLILDGLDRSPSGLSDLLDSAILRSTESQLSIVAATRPGGLLPKTQELLERELGANFRRVTLEPLSTPEAETLCGYLEREDDRRKRTLQKAAGNPLFLREYAKQSMNRPIPGSVRDILSEMIRQLPRRNRVVIDAIALFEQPISHKVLAEIARLPDDETVRLISAPRSMGLTLDLEGLVSIRYPDARVILYSRIPKAKRTRLHWRSFQVLSRMDCDKRLLAREAYEGAAVRQAAELYRELAVESYAQRQFQSVVKCYEMVLRCRVRDAGIAYLEPGDNLRLARSYAFTGEQSQARRMIKILLESPAVAEDPELLSSVYAAAALYWVEESKEERIRLLKLAIESLPPESVDLLSRYRALVAALLSVGDTIGAEETLRAAEGCCRDQRDIRELDEVRSMVLLHRGDFDAAARCLSFADNGPSRSLPSGVLNNLGIAMEHLGDLKRAKELETQALKEARSHGLVVAEIICLGNLACLETKLGNIKRAQELFESALTRIEESRRTDKLATTHVASVTFQDAAFLAIEVGDYSEAKKRFGRIRLGQEGPFHFETFMSSMLRCELYLHLGDTVSAQQMLDCEIARRLTGNFFDVERLLIAYRLQEPSEALCRELEEAVCMSQSLKTTYQQCRLHVALAAVYLPLRRINEASRAARSARRISRRNGYKPLAARALLLMGLSSTKELEKQYSLNGSYREACEIGLPPLISECAYHLGAWCLDRGDYLAAYKYLAHSVAITTRLADGLGAADRKRYIVVSHHLEARRLLDEAATGRVPASSSGRSEALMKSQLLFGALYRLTVAMSAASNTADIVSTLLETLRATTTRRGVLALRSDSRTILYPMRSRTTKENTSHLFAIMDQAAEKPYFTTIGKGGSENAAAWIPIRSLSSRGGIYVEGHRGRVPFDEEEMEFVTIAAAIAGAAMDQIDRRDDSEVELGQECNGIVGISAGIRKIQADIVVAASNAATVLIEGESGTGKELVARAIHERSKRTNAPFIAVDCGALPEELIESELFGARKGAYTGSVQDRIGLFEAGNHGTIFLDEISNMSVSVQAKLLRVIQDRRVRRIGSTVDSPVDVRLIVATNRNLDSMVSRGEFRKDLLYRLRVLQITLPPLRARLEDVPSLAHAFLTRLNTSNHCDKYFGPEVLSRLSGYDYPGNVRELQNLVERAFYASGGRVIADVEFPKPILMDEAVGNEAEMWFKELTEGGKDFWSAVHDRYKRREISRERIRTLVDFGLRSTAGNYKAMAALLRIPEQEYRRFMDFLRRNQCLLDFRPYRRNPHRRDVMSLL